MNTDFELEIRRLSEIEREIFQYLHKKKFVYQTDLAKDLGVDVSTIQRRTKVLAAKRMIIIHKEGGAIRAKKLGFSINPDAARSLEEMPLEIPSIEGLLSVIALILFAVFSTHFGSVDVIIGFVSFGILIGVWVEFVLKKKERYISRQIKRLRG